MSPDPYTILEVGSEASLDEVKASYRRLAALYHPDRNPGFPDAATEKLKQLNAAYALIQQIGPHAAWPDNGRDGGGSDYKEARRPSSPRDAERDPVAEEVDYRTSIARSLARVRAQSRSTSTADDLLVEILSALMPPLSEILGCVPYNAFSSTGPYPSRDVSGRFLRMLPSGLGGPLRQASSTEAVVRLPPSQLVVCTQDVLLWTSSKLGPPDGVVIEEDVTAHSVRFEEILGASARKKGLVDVWVDEGPTLTFRTAAHHAPELTSCIEGASASR